MKLENKICKWCKIIKDISHYYISGNGYVAHCKECDNARRRVKNMSEEQIKNKRARELVCNLSQEQLQIKRKRQNLASKNLNAEQKENRNLTRKNKRINDKLSGKIYKRKSKTKTINQKLRSTISSNINNFLKKNYSNKNGQSSFKYLEFNINQLKEHLEKQFESWMAWDNHGKYNILIWNDQDQSTWTWQLDHIIPQSNLPYISMEDENFKQCWALKNLRPYSAKQNSIDGANRIRHKDIR